MKKSVVSIIMMLLVKLMVSATSAYYIVGSINNYNTPTIMSDAEREKYGLTDEDGDSIYSLKINIPKGQFNFVLFEGIVDWNSSQIYWATEHVELYDETEIQLEKTINRNISYSEWAGGEVRLDFDAKTERLKISNLSVNADEILYLIGNPTNNATPTITNKAQFDKYRYIDRDGDGKYTGSIYIPENGFEFCFAKGLNGDSTTYIVPKDSNIIEFNFNGKYYGETEYSQDVKYFVKENWTNGGSVDFVYDSNQNTISFSGDSLSQAKYLYLTGTPTGWLPPVMEYESILKKWRLENSEENENVYKGEFEIDNSQQLVFRFYNALTGWDGGSVYGCEIDDNIYDYNVDENGIYRGVIKKGKGCWGFTQWPTNKLYIEVDLYNMSVVFASSVTSVETIEENNLKLHKGLNNQFYIESVGNNVNYCVYNMHGTLVKSGNETVIDLSECPLGIYIINVTDGLNSIFDKVMIND